MKGFATSLAIVLSFVAGVILFEFQVTTSFVVGTAIVVSATYLYNQPDKASASRASTAGYSLPSVPISPPRPFIPSSKTPASPRMYPHHQNHNSVSHQSALANASTHSFNNHTMSYNPGGGAKVSHRSSAGSLSGTHTPDHVVGFGNGNGGILDGGIAPQSVPMRTGGSLGRDRPEPLDLEAGGGLHVDTKGLSATAGWVPLSSSSSATSDGRLPSGVTQRPDGRENPLTP